MAEDRFVTTQQWTDGGEVAVEPGDSLGRQAHHAHGGIAGADAEEGSAGCQGVDRGDARGVVGRRTCTGDRDTGAEVDTAGTRRGESQGGVAVRPQHLAVGQPGVGVAEFLGTHHVVDVVDVGGDAHADVHEDSPWLAESTAQFAACGPRRSRNATTEAFGSVGLPK